VDDEGELIMEGLTVTGELLTGGKLGDRLLLTLAKRLPAALAFTNIGDRAGLKP
jgi:hypothetical protein